MTLLLQKGNLLYRPTDYHERHNHYSLPMWPRGWNACLVTERPWFDAWVRSYLRLKTCSGSVALALGLVGLVPLYCDLIIHFFFAALKLSK